MPLYGQGFGLIYHCFLHQQVQWRSYNVFHQKKFLNFLAVGAVWLVAAHIMAVGPGAYLTKVDVRNTFRLCPVRPADWFLLGIYWEKHYYYDRVLPFGWGGVLCPEEYATHYLRIGAATTTAIAGEPKHLIRHMGRGRASAALKYIRVSSIEVSQLSAKLASVE